MNARQKAKEAKRRQACIELGEFIGAAEPKIYFIRVAYDRRSGNTALRAFMCIAGDSINRPREVTWFFRDILALREDKTSGGFVVPYVNMDPAYHAVDAANRYMVDYGAQNAGTLERHWL